MPIIVSVDGAAVDQFEVEKGPLISGENDGGRQQFT